MCTCDEAIDGAAAGTMPCEARLPADPFTAIQFHYGMLLGVDDLEVTQSYARGKMRLHNAWLHGPGVVWGLGVDIDSQKHLRVLPGLALDGAGHELHLDSEMCLDLGKWYEGHREDEHFAFDVDPDDGTVRFSARVVIAFRACLARQVPALRDPCGGAAIDTAYSRAFETVCLTLEPIPTADDPLPEPPYRRLRILFGLADDGGEARYLSATEWRGKVQAAVDLPEQRGIYLRAFHELAAFDEIDLRPQAGTAGKPGSLFPEDPSRVVLADVIGIVLVPGEGGVWSLKTVEPPEASPAIDVAVRPSHVATSTIQELQWLFAPPSGGGPAPTEAPGAATRVRPTMPATPHAVAEGETPRSGPVILSAEAQTSAVKFEASEPLALGNLKQSFAVSFWGGDAGWVPVEIKEVEQLRNETTYRVLLRDRPGASPIRFIARGTGPAPVVARSDLRPLGSPGANGPDDGTDYVRHLERSGT